MSIKLTEELLHLDTLVGQNTGEVAVEGTLVLPSHKPVCAEIVKVIAAPKTSNIQMEEDRVVAEGFMDVTLIYLTIDEEDAISYEAVTWERVLPFATVLDVPGAMPGMEAAVELNLGETNFDISADGRSMLVECVIEGFTKVTSAQETWVVTDALTTTSRKLNVDSETIRVDEVLSQAEGQFEVTGTVALQTGAPFIDELFYASGKAVVTSARYQQEKLIINGVLSCDILYRPEEEQTVLAKNWPDGIRFEQVLAAEGAVSGLHPDIVLSIQDFQARPVVGGSGLELKAVISVKAKAIETRAIPLVTSISGDKDGTEIVCKKEEIRLEKSVGSGVQTLPSKFTIEMPESKPPIDKIIAFTAQAVATDKKIQSNRVFVSGFISVEMLYEGHVDLDDPPIYAAQWDNANTFEVMIDVPGAEPDMDVQVGVEVANQFPDLINRETCEVSIDIKVTAKVTETIDCEVVEEAVEIKHPTGRAPSYVCVIVQPDDTLWKIATRYGSTVETLVNYNPDLADIDEAELPIGMRLFIPRQAKSVAES